MGINKVILIGNVGKDPEVKKLDSGVSVANFPLATSETYKKDGEKIENTEWHNIVIWKNLAEIVERYVKKGTKLYLEGKITTRSWDDNDGNKKYMTEIVCYKMEMLSMKTSENSDTQQQDGVNQQQPSNDQSDDLPF